MRYAPINCNVTCMYIIPFQSRPWCSRLVLTSSTCWRSVTTPVSSGSRVWWWYCPSGSWWSPWRPEVLSREVHLCHFCKWPLEVDYLNSMIIYIIYIRHRQSDTDRGLSTGVDVSETQLSPLVSKDIISTSTKTSVMKMQFVCLMLLCRLIALS